MTGYKQEFDNIREYDSNFAVDPHVNDESYIDEDEEPLSVCCGASVVSDSDICSDCKEHTSIQVTCMGCGGIGHVFISEHQNEPCPNSNCEDGFIILE